MESMMNNEPERQAYISNNAEVAKLLGRIYDLEHEIVRLDALVEYLELQIEELVNELRVEHITLGGNHE
jgi:predicted HTH domain antitoxin